MNCNSIWAVMVVVVAVRWLESEQAIFAKYQSPTTLDGWWIV